MQHHTASQAELIFDVGLHRGEDTRRYLDEGNRVVAIDANPQMCAMAERTFRREIADGRLTVINCGISQKSEKLTFWVCDDVTAWSSFDRRIASRRGARHHSVEVECRSIADIVANCGVPDYMKIDIEGNDRICIEGLTPETAPRFISIELNHEAADPDRDINRLYELGYRGFKIICQNNFWEQVTALNLWRYRLGSKSRLDPLLIKAEGLLRRFNGRRRLLRGRQVGESGPWGELTDGKWQTRDYVLSVWADLIAIDRSFEAEGLGWWHDLHAAK